MATYTFYDYIDADGNGTNVIRSWLNGDGKDAKPRFAVLIPLMETSSPPGSENSFWTEPYAKLLKNRRREKWGGFTEIRIKAKNVQYRLLGQIEGRAVFLVACGIHKDQHFTTDVSPETALNRINQMKNSPAKYRREHEYN